jgi:ADP-heptose:LPS heptosyltransferase
LPQNYVLVCPQAAMALRVMPDAIHDFILERLTMLQPLPVVTQGQHARDRAGRIISVPDCASLPELAGLVSGAALIVSTDTAMVHLADAFSVPCLAFFTTHRPEWRVRDYPLCRPVHRPARLPEAIEFARGPADVEAAHAAWFGPTHLDWLDAALQQAIAEFITGR